MTITPVEDFETLPGFGNAATIQGRKVEVGADHYMKRLGYPLFRAAPPGRGQVPDGRGVHALTVALGLTCPIEHEA